MATCVDFALLRSVAVRPLNQCQLNNQDVRVNFIVTVLMEKRGKEMKVRKG